MVILDLGLPRISGYDVLKALKQEPELKEIPVIVLTTSRHVQGEPRRPASE